MIFKVQDLINKSFSKLGLTDNGVVTDIQMMNDAFIDLNIMLDELAADSLFCIGSVLVSFPLVPNQQSYTIGIGGNFNTPMPMKITDAYIRDSANIDYPLSIISLEQWMTLPDKAVTKGQPEMLYYSLGAPQQTTPKGTINLYYTPSNTYTLFIGEQNPITEFASLQSNVTFLPIYFSFLMWNLSKRLLADYPISGRERAEIIFKRSAETETLLESLNARRMVAQMTSPGKRPAYWNVLTGDYI